MFGLIWINQEYLVLNIFKYLKFYVVEHSDPKCKNIKLFACLQHWLSDRAIEFVITTQYDLIFVHFNLYVGSVWDNSILLLVAHKHKVKVGTLPMQSIPCNVVIHKK